MLNIFTKIRAEDFNFQYVCQRTEVMPFQLWASDEAQDLGIPLLWPFVEYAVAFSSQPPNPG